MEKIKFIFVIALTIFIGCVLAKKDDIKKPGSDITCENIISKPPNQCCKSFPNFPKPDNKSIAELKNKCKESDDPICCVMTNALADKKVKGYAADGKFDAKAIAEFFTKNSGAKDKKAYSKFALDVVQWCIKNITNTKGCQSLKLIQCSARKLFMECPDKENSKNCASVYEAAVNCPDYPLPKPGSRKGDAEKMGEKPQNNKDKNDTSDKGNGKNKNEPKTSEKNEQNPTKDQESPKGKDKGKSTDKKERGKVNQANSNKVYTSESGNGALGPNGPTFRIDK